MNGIILFLVVSMKLLIAQLNGIEEIVGHIISLILVHLGGVDVHCGTLFTHWLEFEVAFDDLRKQIVTRALNRCLLNCLIWEIGYIAFC